MATCHHVSHDSSHMTLASCTNCSTVCYCGMSRDGHTALCASVLPLVSSSTVLKCRKFLRNPHFLFWKGFSWCNLNEIWGMLLSCLNNGFEWMRQLVLWERLLSCDLSDLTQWFRHKSQQNVIISYHFIFKLYQIINHCCSYLEIYYFISSDVLHQSREGQLITQGLFELITSWTFLQMIA